MEENTQQLDPNKSYSWKNTDEFKLDGQEFQILNNLLLEKVKKFNLPENKELIMEYEAFKIMQNKLAEAVSTGIAKEVTSIPPQS